MGLHWRVALCVLRWLAWGLGHINIEALRRVWVGNIQGASRVDCCAWGRQTNGFSGLESIWVLRIRSKALLAAAAPLFQPRSWCRQIVWWEPSPRKGESVEFGQEILASIRGTDWSRMAWMLDRGASRDPWETTFDAKVGCPHDYAIS